MDPWTSPREPDTVAMRSGLTAAAMTVPLFPLKRREVVVGGVQPMDVLPGDPAEGRGSCLGAGAVVAAVDQLHLEGGEPALGDGVVQA
jgi:hypothetical protein